MCVKEINEKAVSKGFVMFKAVNRDQDCFLPKSLRDSIPEDNPIHLIIDVVENLDTRRIEIKHDSLGQNSYHPKMMLAILLYAYSQSTFSSRRIEEALRYDVRFMYIAGMHRVSHNRICDFRRENHEEIADIFVQIVNACQSIGIVLLKSISIDGSKIQAVASNRKLRDREALAKEFKDTEAEIARLLDHAQAVDDAEEEAYRLKSDARLRELEDRKRRLENAQATLDANASQQRINLTDPECREQKSIGSGYNVQIAVDCENQIIVAADVVPCPEDVDQLLPMIDQIENNTSSKGHSKRINADAGYASGHNYEQLAEKPHIDAYVPSQAYVHLGDAPRPLFDKSRFNFDSENETSTCPLGQPMRLLSREWRRKVRNIRFKGVACPNCPAKFLCTEAEYRQVRMTLADDLVRQMNEKMSTPVGKEAMCERRQTVETAFGQLKNNMGFRKFGLHGLAKVKGEFTLLCCAFNLMKMHRSLSGRELAQILVQIPEFILDFLFFNRSWAYLFAFNIRFR